MSVSFVSGPKGEKPRSDVRVRYSPSDKPLVIEISSKVQALFGGSLRRQAEGLCRHLGVTTGSLLLEDFGAFPFVVAARMEAVLKQANPAIQAEFLPEMEAFSVYTSTRERFRRSRLYIPGNQPRWMLNAGIHKPDGIILDLEDSVAPGEKEAARYIVRNALRVVDFFGAERMVRINQGDWGLLDLEYVVPHNVHLILIPKVESAKQVQDVDEKVQEICRRCNRSEPVFLMPIIESARGALDALAIAKASPNNVALTIGLEDYTADIGACKTDKGAESFFAGSIIINAARATGIQPIDSVFSDVDDMEGLMTSALEAKSLGFDGKGCIHPRQIKPIHEAFAPSETEIEWAKRVVEAFEEARKQGLGVVVLGSKMIDPPVVKRAQRVVDLQEMGSAGR